MEAGQRQDAIALTLSKIGCCRSSSRRAFSSSIELRGAAVVFNASCTLATNFLEVANTSLSPPNDLSNSLESESTNICGKGSFELKHALSKKCHMG